MKIRPFPLESGHPANHGYVKCFRCGVWRRADQVEAKGFGATTEGIGCVDSCQPSTKPSHYAPPTPTTEKST